MRALTTRFLWIVPGACALFIAPACGSSGDPSGSGGSAGASEDGGNDTGGRSSSGGKSSGGGANASGGRHSGGRDGGPTGGRSSETGGKPGSSGGMGGAVELPPTLTTCNLGGAPNVGEGDSLVSIDSFDDDDAAFSGAGLNGGWYAYGDGTAGTLLTSDGFVPVPGGVEGGAFRVQAGGFTGWGSVFGAYLSEGCLFDGARYDGITFYAKGHVTGAPSEAVSVRLVGLDDITPELGGLCEADCWNSPHFEIEIEEDCYRRYSIRFDEFLRLGETTGQLAPEELYLIDFAIGMADSSDIWVDQLSFFTGDKPAPEEICD